jgi:adenosylhomocysteinase
LDTLLFEDLNEEERSSLIEKGSRRLEWALSFMPVLSTLSSEIKEKGTLKGIGIAMALHTEAKTGVLALSLAEAGARVRLTSCNPLSTDDSVSLALMKKGIDVRARHGESREDYYRALNWALDMEPQVIIDDGGDLLKLIHTERRELLGKVLGGCEETTTGIIRLKAMEREGKLEIPMMNVNDCAMKHFFDNRYGTGQSTMDGILNATNLTIAGRKVSVAGYGWCGKGIAMRLKGLGAVVTISEVDPVKAVEAVHDGFNVKSLKEAAPEADMIITATGCKDVVNREIIRDLKDNCTLANSGHFDNEIDVSHLRKFSSCRTREHVETFDINGKRINLLSEGRLVNLASGQGHPVEIMDMSFAIQMAGAEMIARGGLPKGVIDFPDELDRKIALIKLRSMGATIDTLTDEQKDYLSSWEEGT